MIETNIRIVESRNYLSLKVREAKVNTQDIIPELLEKSCNGLANKHSLSAVKDSLTASQILVLTNNHVPNIILKDDNWQLEVKDNGSKTLHFSNPNDQFLMTQLLERSLLKEISRKQEYWNLDSLRMFYEKTPFIRSGGVAAYRRYEISSIDIDGVGVGLIVDIGTAFFTIPTVADFFIDDVSKKEKKLLRQRFEKLSQRQKGSKGTLLYEYKPGKFTKCYFVEFCPDVTVSTRMTLRVEGKTYNSLQDYYKRKHNVQVGDDEPVAKVSFPGIDHTVYVSAKKLRLRVMNNALPTKLRNADKNSPYQRYILINRFWERLGNNPLGNGKPQVETKFWRPEPNQLFHAAAPHLLFGEGEILTAPLNGNIRKLKNFFAERIEFLNRYGCFYVPPNAPRTLYIAMPKSFKEFDADYLSDSVVELINKWTKLNMDVQLVSYDTQADAIKQLKKESSSGVVLFVFDDEDPASYFNISFELRGWRIKRITKSKLEKIAAQFGYAKDAKSGRSKVTRSPRNWDSFITMNVLDVLQQMNCVPWTLAEKPMYEARLAIDVGKKHSFFALSLLIFQNGKSKPFRLDTEVENKNDSKKETINEIFLEDAIVKICERAVKAGYVDLGSFLTSRDGRKCGDEDKAIQSAVLRSNKIGFLSENVKFDNIDFHKNSVKNIRIWDHTENGRVNHAVEGTGISINSKTVVITNTGAASLQQGTAVPVVLFSEKEDIDLVKTAKDMYKSCHLNWSSPGKAQRLPLELKRTDEELKNRDSQEIRRLR